MRPGISLLGGGGYIKISTRLVLVGTVLGLIIIVLALFPSEEDKYERLLRRGLTEPLVAELEHQLQRHPAWHQGRDLLIEAYLQMGRLDLALTQLLEVKDQGKDPWQWQGELSNWNKDNFLDSNVLIESVTLLQEEIAVRPQWHWAQEFLLEIIISQQAEELAVDAVELLLTVDSAGFFGARMYPRPQQLLSLLDSSDKADLDTIQQMITDCVPEDKNTIFYVTDWFIRYPD